MQYYTRQQIQGAGRYQPGVLIGNWKEDRNIEEIVLKDFIERKDAKDLRIDNFQAKLDIALAPVELTVKAEDGYVHFGDVVQLASADSKAVVAINIAEKDCRPGNHAYGATAADKYVSPCARNAVILAAHRPDFPHNSTQISCGDTVRYGQKLRVIAHPGAQELTADTSGGTRPLYLFSKQVGSMITFGIPNPSVDFVVKLKQRKCSSLQIVAPDPAIRIATDGLEGKKLMLCHESRGELTATIPSANLAPNMFMGHKKGMMILGGLV